MYNSLQTHPCIIVIPKELRKYNGVCSYELIFILSKWYIIVIYRYNMLCQLAVYHSVPFRLWPDAPTYLYTMPRLYNKIVKLSRRSRVYLLSAPKGCWDFEYAIVWQRIFCGLGSLLSKISVLLLCRAESYKWFKRLIDYHNDSREFSNTIKYANGKN